MTSTAYDEVGSKIKGKKRDTKSTFKIVHQLTRAEQDVRVAICEFDDPDEYEPRHRRHQELFMYRGAMTFEELKAKVNEMIEFKRLAYNQAPKIDRVVRYYDVAPPSSLRPQFAKGTSK